jgi:hypothetical protein
VTGVVRLKLYKATSLWQGAKTPRIGGGIARLASSGEASLVVTTRGNSVGLLGVLAHSHGVTPALPTAPVRDGLNSSVPNKNFSATADV